MQDPKQAGNQPPFPVQRQPHPGIESKMEPRPDFGAQSYKGTGRLAGRTALITGGDSGIGRAVALAYAREGADVLISYLNEDSDARETAEIIEDAGRKAVLAPGDIAEVSHCRDLVRQAESELGRIDILVNNAAYQMQRDGIAEFSAEEWDFTLRTNISAMFHLAQAALPRMREGSAIINTSSVQAYHPTPQLLPYATTKGAIVAFTKALALETIERGIRVNAVAPGPVWTPLIVSTMSEEHASHFGEAYPMSRPAQPAELAPVYVFLASDESRYINGEVIGVTGGKPLG
jgi:NAD(P)-dependent dehydrogenase (short-subunit alcohol dehydrogenase family)